MRPRIVVSASYLPARALPEGPAGWGVSVKATYTDAVQRAGGLPIVAPPLDDTDAVRELIAEADGLLLVGGDDLPAERWGRPTSKLAATVHERRAAMDFALLEAALAAGKAVFGVCLGCQILNVHYGGTLFQDLIAERPEELIRHQRKPNSPYLSHPVAAARDSLLLRIAEADRIEVNSGHHQGIENLGAGLIASAHAPDGLIEAVEDPARPFVLGVQWHPEEMAADPAQQRLFRAFVEAAGGK